MSEFEWIHIIWAFGALALAAGCLAGYRLSWKRSIVYALMWAAIFTAVTLFINAVNV
ncbi:hypothetical protein [Pontixanthobacter aquaemixtae]|uniref:hypothetical protein n=1 Tax=Pontixanthobacter aquaemixtae TaxID=1958940 RepID=UPI001926515B|nr:hypothetical protein [Pontixanthobacter aquaemixtae]